MAICENAPQFFVAGVEGLALEGPNVIISFATPILSPDHNTREYKTNVRIALSIDSLKQAISFIEKSLQEPASASTAMPAPQMKQ